MSRSLYDELASWMAGARARPVAGVPGLLLVNRMTLLAFRPERAHNDGLRLVRP